MTIEHTKRLMWLYIVLAVVTLFGGFIEYLGLACCIAYGVGTDIAKGFEG